MQVVKLSAVAGLVILAGCGQFFPPKTAGSGSGSGSGSGGGSGSGSGSGAGSGAATGSVYVANTNSQLNSIAAYSLTNGTLANLKNSPSQLAVAPSALALNPAGSLLWAGSQLGGLYVYVVNSDGSLTLGNNSTAVTSSLVSAMTVDPTGQWLLVLSNTGLGSAPLVFVYAINSTNGTLTQTGTQIALDAGTATQIAFAPTGTQVFATLGTGGVDELSFAPTTGALAKLNVRVSPSGNSYADQGIAVATTASASYLLIAETGTNGVRVLSINANGTLNEIGGSPYPTGLGARAVLADKNGHVYVANSGTNTLSAFSLSATGTLTEITGSPYTTGTSPYALTEDGTGGYLLAACVGGTPDLQVFSIGASSGSTPGALTSVTKANTGTVSPAGAVAVAAK